MQPQRHGYLNVVGNYDIGETVGDGGTGVFTQSEGPTRPTKSFTSVRAAALAPTISMAAC